MSKDNDENPEDGGIYRVETIPPPEGESDPYGAPTRVGPMDDSVEKDVRPLAEESAAPLPGPAPGKVASVAEPPRPTTPKKPPLPASALRPAPAPSHSERSIPRVYDDIDEDNAATILSTKATPPPTRPAPAEQPPPVQPPPALPLPFAQVQLTSSPVLRAPPGAPVLQAPAPPLAAPPPPEAPTFTPPPAFTPPPPAFTPRAAASEPYVPVTRVLMPAPRTSDVPSIPVPTAQEPALTPRMVAMVVASAIVFVVGLLMFLYVD